MTACGWAERGVAAVAQEGDGLGNCADSVAVRGRGIGFLAAPDVKRTSYSPRPILGRVDWLGLRDQSGEPETLESVLGAVGGTQ